VAVIDTGFDVTGNRQHIANSDFQVKKGYDGAGDAGKDEGGHGTMVVGVIAGKDGVGIAPKAQVTSYRITEPRYTGGGVSGATLKMAITATKSSTSAGAGWPTRRARSVTRFQIKSSIKDWRKRAVSS
jgi:subtilisin family serine protease